MSSDEAMNVTTPPIEEIIQLRKVQCLEILNTTSTPPSGTYPRDVLSVSAVWAYLLPCYRSITLIIFRTADTPIKGSRLDRGTCRLESTNQRKYIYFPGLCLWCVLWFKQTNTTAFLQTLNSKKKNEIVFHTKKPIYVQVGYDCLILTHVCLSLDVSDLESQSVYSTELDWLRTTTSRSTEFYLPLLS